MRSLSRVLLAAITLAGLVVGCGNDVKEPQISNATVRNGSELKFRDALQECQTVSLDQIAEVVGGNSASQSFYGAICRFTVGGQVGSVEVTFNWFESGSLEGERTALEKLGYDFSDVSVQSWKAVQAQPPNDPDSCGVTARAPDAGVVGWWVQYRPGSAHPDPCTTAIDLLKLTLNVAR